MQDQSTNQYIRPIIFIFHQKFYMKDKEQSEHSSFMADEPLQIISKNNKKESQQFKALFLKNLRLQSKQKGTNLCQILTPILCILFTYLMKAVAEQNIKVGAVFQPLLYPLKFSNFLQFDQLNPLANRNKLQWMTYACEQNCDKQVLGVNDGQGNKSGILGSIQPSFNSTVTYHRDPKNLLDTIKLEVPFFLPYNQSSINNMILSRLRQLNELNFTEMKRSGGFDYVPDGVYNITLLNQTHLGCHIKVNDLRQIDIHRSNGLTAISFDRFIKEGGYYFKDTKIAPDAGLLTITHWLNQAFLKNSLNKTIESGIFFMPQDESGISFIDTLISVIAILIFPVSLSLLFPVYLYTVVLQKEEKLIQMMKMNGMKISSYWFVYFIFNLILGLLTNTIFVVFGMLLTGMRFFTQTDPLIIIVVLLGWTLAQIGMAVFFQTFLNKSRSANIIGYLISIWTSMIGSTLCIGVYQYPNQLPMGARFFAPFSFTRIIYILLSGCSQGKCFGSIQNIPTEMKHQIVLLYANFVFFFFLGAYLFEIIPQQFGVTRNVLFPFSMLKKLFKKDNKLSDNQINEDLELKKYIGKKDEDDFSKKERYEVLNGKNIIQENPLVINNLRKLYYKEGMKKMYAAVKSFNLKVGPKQTFGLLGPNGAGKTTLISMITGMFEPNYGNAWIGGYDIKESIEKAQLQMGVCPQFDLLWPQLTVIEHLYFYARLKGIPSSLTQQKVHKAIQEVKLTQFKDFPSSSLSGGMRRRLSVAISLVGDPRIVFLDEPSTGLDPQNRRQLWEVLAKCQKNRAIFITTHMMEQADALCNRVGIITKGVLRTVAPQSSLKNTYGGGYRVSISVTKDERRLVDRDSIGVLDRGDRIQDMDHELGEGQEQQDLKRSINSFIQTQQQQKNQKTNKRVNKILNFMTLNFPGSVLLKRYNGYLIFKVLPEFKVSEIFQKVQKIQKQLEVVDVAITNSSLQDVFMNVVKQHQNQEQFDSEFNIKEKDDRRESFPDDSKMNEDNINQTPSNSKQLKKSTGSSVISKHRQSEISKNIKKSTGSAGSRDSGDNEKPKKNINKKLQNDDSDYY